MMNNHIPLHISPSLFERVCPPTSQQGTDYNANTPTESDTSPRTPFCRICNSTFRDFAELNHHQEEKRHYFATGDTSEKKKDDISQGVLHVQRHFEEEKKREEGFARNRSELYKTVIPKIDVQRVTKLGAQEKVQNKAGVTGVKFSAEKPATCTAKLKEVGESQPLGDRVNARECGSSKNDSVIIPNGHLEEIKKDKNHSGISKHIRQNSTVVLKVSKGVNTIPRESKIHRKLSHKLPSSVVKDGKDHFLYANSRNTLFVPDTPNAPNKNHPGLAEDKTHKIMPHVPGLLSIPIKKQVDPSAKVNSIVSGIPVAPKIKHVGSVSFPDGRSSRQLMPEKPKGHSKSLVDPNGISELKSKQPRLDSKLFKESLAAKLEEDFYLKAGERLKDKRLLTTNRDLGKEKMNLLEPKINTSDREMKTGATNIYSTHKVIEACLKCRAQLLPHMLTVNVIKGTLSVPCVQCHAVNEMIGVFKPKV